MNSLCGDLFREFGGVFRGCSGLFRDYVGRPLAEKRVNIIREKEENYTEQIRRTMKKHLNILKLVFSLNRDFSIGKRQLKPDLSGEILVASWKFRGCWECSWVSLEMTWAIPGSYAQITAVRFHTI